MSRHAICLLLALGLSLAGCAAMDVRSPQMAEQARKSGESLGPALMAPAPPQAAEEVPYLAVVEPRKVVYTGAFQIVVGDVAGSLSAAKGMAEKLGGYMQQMTSSGLVLRVPADKFNQAVEALENMGAVTQKNIAAQDVTERYNDLQIRLKNGKALLEKLRGLLEKAAAIKDALEIEKEIARVTTEIEQLEGQINSLSSQIAYATLTITFTPMASAPQALKARLPFYWLKELGLDSLLRF